MLNVLCIYIVWNRGVAIKKNVQLDGGRQSGRFNNYNGKIRRTSHFISSHQRPLLLTSHYCWQTKITTIEFFSLGFVFFFRLLFFLKTALEIHIKGKKNWMLYKLCCVYAHTKIMSSKVESCSWMHNRNMYTQATTLLSIHSSFEWRRERELWTEGGRES